LISFFLRQLPVVARGTTLLLNAIMAVVIARTFGAAASGEFFLAFSVINVLGMVGRLGTENQAIKALPQLFHEKNLDAFWGHLKWLRRVCLLGAFAAGGITFILGFALVFSKQGGQFGPHLMILAASIPLSSASILESSALRSAGRTSLGAFAETGLSQGLTIVSLLALTAAATLDPLVISICYTASSAVTTALAFYWTRRGIIGGRVPFRERPKQAREATMTSMLQMMGSSVLFFVLTSSPVFVLGISATARDIGFYNAAARSSTLISLIPALQTTYLMPRLALSLGTGKLAEANRLLRRAVRQASLVTLLIALLMLTLSEQIVSIFGRDFEAARSTLIILTIGQSILIFLGNVNPVMALVGLERSSLLAVGAAIIVGVGPMAYVAGVYGALGAACVYMAISVGYSVVCNVILLRARSLKCLVS
jgi:O-antigen/teichoic acid export membrane protein